MFSWPTNYDYCYTLAGVISSEGIGLHSGEKTRVTISPYEAFCMGGTSSVRGWGSCDLAVSKSFIEGTAEYRFPVWRMISGALFVDAGSDLGSQKNVPGKPGKLLQKSGSGFSLGGGVGVKTPIGPLRLDIASKDLSGDWRYTLGVGWKF